MEGVESKHFRNERLDSHYGQCEYEKHCLTHEYESVCKKFERMDGGEE